MPTNDPAKYNTGLTCTHCGGSVGSATTCPHCGQRIATDQMGSGDQAKPAEGSNHIQLIVSSSGWIASLLVHLVGLLTFAAISVGPDLVARGPEVEVALVDRVIDEQIGAGTPELVMPLDQSRLVDLVDLTVEATLEVAPLTQKITTEVERQFSALLSAQHSADANLVGMDADWSGLHNPSGGGKFDSANFFGLTALGGRFVYVIDSSGSMKGEQIELAKAEAKRSISQMNPNQKFFLIFYNDNFWPMPAEQLVRATPENMEMYLNWIQDVHGDGGTKPIDAMLVALALGPDVIYFLSDGQFPDEVVDVIRETNKGKRVQIFTIAYHNPDGLKLLQQIADENRGKCRFVSPTEETDQP